MPLLPVLRNGALECRVDSALGGGLLAFDLLGRDGRLPLMRPAAAGITDPLDLACFPLVPFANRVAAGRFVSDGLTVTLPLNLPPHPHAMHGHGWQAAWTVLEATASALLLAYDHAADAWPFAYRAVQSYVLDEGGLTIALALTNRGTRRLPAGLGLHPHFPKPPGTRLTAGVSAVWLNDGTGLPRACEALPPGWDLPRGLVLDGVVLDNGFRGWDGRAEILWPDRDLALDITADPVFGHLQVYAPFGRDLLCVEPVSHRTDALNHPDEPDSGLVMLEPGATVSGSVRFSPRRPGS